MRLSLVATLIATVCCAPGSWADPPLQDEVRDPAGQTYRVVMPQHFQMGAGPWGDFRKDHTQTNETDNRPVHPVILTRPYYVATTEVTVGQFRRFVQQTGYESKLGFKAVGWDPSDDQQGNIQRSFREGDDISWQAPGFEQTDDHPVTCVSYADAQAYCRWLSSLEPGTTYRLPTEAEWECAARAGTTTHFGFGDDYRDVIQKHANVADVALEQTAPGRTLDQWLIDIRNDPSDGFALTAPVGHYQPNASGLHDMHGNVWEWCSDRYLDTWYEQFKKGRHGQVRRRSINPRCTEAWNQHGPWQVIRGGSWFNAPLQCRSGTRGVFHAEDAACYLGFRVVREVDSQIAERFDQQHERSEAALRLLVGSRDENGWPFVVDRSTDPTPSTRVREYDDGIIRIEILADNLDDDLLVLLTALQYQVEVTVRPPGFLNSETIRRLHEIPRLVGLRLATPIEGLDDKTFEWLTEKRSLRSFQMTAHGELSDAMVFPHLRGAVNLEDLSLSGGNITDAGLRNLPADAPLRQLHLDSTACRGESLDHFAEAKLTDVSLDRLSDAGAEVIGQFTSINNLNVSESDISGAGLSELARLRRIERLRLSGCSNLQPGDFTELERFPFLMQLDLEGTEAGDDAIDALIKSTNLRELRVDATKCSQAGLNRIGELLGLVDLSIGASAPSNVQVTSETLTRWLELPNLRRLEISRNAIDLSEEKLTELKDSFPNVRLQIR